MRLRFPDAHLAVITGKVPDEVIRLSGLADEVIAVDRVELRDGRKLASIRKVLRFVKDTRRRSVDLVIDLHSLSETNVLAFMTRSRHRLLANRESRSLDLLSNFAPKPPREDKSKHLTDRYLDVLIPLGITKADRFFRLNAHESEVESVKGKFFADEGKGLVGLFPGAGHPSRCWPLASFAEVAHHVESIGCRPSVFLGPEESGLFNDVQSRFPSSTIVVHGLSISEFVAAAQCLKAFVTNDTGPMHLAACAGTPIVLLLDERAPTTYLPLTPDLVVVQDRSIDQIRVADVQAAVNGILSGSPAGVHDK
ncbi:MAG: glycosyltransferase family 9 protein [Pyrinomonadaceae bacterium]